MKNLVASSIVTALLMANLLVAVVLGAVTSNFTVAVGQGIWLIPAFLWLRWSVRRHRRLRVQGHDPEPVSRETDRPST